MKFWSATSIKNKLMWLLLSTSCTALLLSAIGFAVNDWWTLRIEMRQRLQAQAEIIGHNSIAALTFGDLKSAEETLDSLKSQADIVGAILYTPSGARFASYQRDSKRSLPERRPEQNSGYLQDAYFVVYPMFLDDEEIGSIMVASDFSYWKELMYQSWLTVCGVFLLSFFAAWLISRRLQQEVSEPILRLSETARKVSETQDYQLRAKKLHSDEIGMLVDDFNGMLEQIQKRDHQLREAQALLEEKVKERTLELTELARQLEHQAYHDTLTGLANRNTFDDHLKLAIDQAKRFRYSLAVMFLDLDRFKNINDSLGHAVGDRLLINISKRLQSCLRESDTLARLGGDEFAVLLPHIQKAEDAIEVADKISKEVDQTIQIEGYSLHVTTSIGISVYPADGAQADVIVKNADTAMYRSKELGRNQYTFFSAEMNARAERRLLLETKLRKAIAEEQLYVHYQPRLDVRTMRIVSVEALARWDDFEEGPIHPSEFIPLAEECGLIAMIDEWILKQACCDMLAWTEGCKANIQLAVNVSPAQFVREDLNQVIADILYDTGFPGYQLELEITESLIGPDGVDVYSILESLCKLGIQLSIDDFGTAYSSLSRLKQLPLHTLKIDRSFIRDLGVDPNDESLVQTIILLGHNMGLKVIAEGIENELQLDFVRQYGCDVVQGFLFGKPVADLKSLKIDAKSTLL